MMKSVITYNSMIASLIVMTFLLLPGVQSSSSHAQELKKVRIGYPAFSLTFLTFFVAKDAGIYKKHGSDVDLVQMARGGGLWCGSSSPNSKALAPKIRQNYNHLTSWVERLTRDSRRSPGFFKTT